MTTHQKGAGLRNGGAVRRMARSQEQFDLLVSLAGDEANFSTGAQSVTGRGERVGLTHGVIA